ncbi:site-2 protease family protein [Sagittula salina]|uniref:Zinc metalloprotease n=1 Tax=Sagittula salina TaxID=2820268 RepID=A0A940MQU0_9RHOB|nr:site-2 protease family protein [Sagittula salina]MBP0483038.1 site-2 protease family protein [Sagittula salina]
MTWSFPIGRLLGSELRVHATFFLLLAWIGASAYGTSGAAAAVDSVLFVLLLFACVVAHEYGHALMARRYGIRTPDITLLPIGGLARLDRMPEKPGQEIAVALAGPAVNIVIWGVLTLAGASAAPEVLADMTAPGGLAARVASVNLVLAVFNMLPAFPMDGGRVLRAALSLKMDRVRATRIAANAGQVLATALGLWGLYSGGIILVLIALFIWVAAEGEAQDVSVRSTARNLLLRDAMITSFEALSPKDTLHTAGQTLIRTTQHEFPILDADQRLLGFLTRQALFTAMAQQHAGPVADFMSDVPALPLSAPLLKVLEALEKAPAVAAVDQAGHVLGYVTAENIGELMVLRRPR